MLGLVFATAGSTYQKPGAVVLLGAAGMVHGAISGGCLEPELEDRARVVQRSGRAATIEFDTRSDEDLIFGSGTGCRGRIHLLLLPQTPGAPLTRALNRLVAEGGVLDIGISVEGPEVGSGQASIRGTTWSWGCDGQLGLFQETPATVALRIAAPPRILLFGAGPETLTLNLFTRRVGWLLQVVEQPRAVAQIRTFRRRPTGHRAPPGRSRGSVARTTRQCRHCDDSQLRAGHATPGSLRKKRRLVRGTSRSVLPPRRHAGRPRTGPGLPLAGTPARARGVGLGRKRT